MSQVWSRVVSVKFKEDCRGPPNLLLRNSQLRRQKSVESHLSLTLMPVKLVFITLTRKVMAVVSLTLTYRIFILDRSHKID